MFIKLLNLAAVASMAFLFVFGCSSCAVNTVESQAVTPTPTPAQEDNWRPSGTGAAIARDLPDDLPAHLVKLVPSTISEDIVNYKAGHPSASATEIAEYGNSLLPLKGYNYWIDIADLNEKKEKDARILSDDVQTYPFAMSLSNGKSADFLIFAPRHDSCCCGYWYADFPVTRITEASISFISGGKTYTVNRPKDFGHNEVYSLVDEKNPSRTLRRWQIPYETYPQGISADGKRLYVEAPVDEILLEIDAAGTFRFVDKAVVRSTEAESCITMIAPEDGYEGCTTFKIAGRKYHIKFSGPCT